MNDRFWQAELVESMQRRLEEPPLEGPELRRLMAHLQDPDPVPPATAAPPADKGPADGPGALPAGADVEFRRVACEGRWDRPRTVRVGPRARRVHGVSEKGFLLITPLVPLAG